MTLRTCTRCNASLPATTEYFVPAKHCKHGLTPKCRTCVNANCAAWKRKNAVRIAARRREQYATRYGPIAREKEAQRKQRAPLRRRAQILRSGMRDRSKEHGLDFDSAFFSTDRIMEWLSDNPHCECCGRELRLTFFPNGAPCDASPSIDRFDTAGGYTQDNVALLCWRCNNLKRDATAEELQQIVNWIDSREPIPWTDSPRIAKTTIPVIPPEGLLESMAVRYNHAFGMGSAGFTDEEIERARNGMGDDRLDALMARQLLTTREREVTLGTMRQLHEEVVGKGFYRYAERSTPNAQR